MSTKSNKTLIGWEVFWVADLYDTGNRVYQSMRHGTRAEARDQMRNMKAQPWTFKTVFMTRVSHDRGRTIWERAR